jgi:murein DD-endopeptidase MepM/ murein hydrolase activator NlpD
MVIAGEFLGLVGSPGFSTHPHLHFEYDSPAGPSSDPQSGSCRAGPSYWVYHRPYRDSPINLVLTHNAVPEFVSGCPNPTQETRHEHHDFLVGETIVAAVYPSDQEQAQVTTLRLFRPDGSLHSDWMLTSPGAYSASCWNWNIAQTTAGLGESPMPGLWRFEAQHFNGTADSVNFTVGGVLFQHGFE